MTGVVPTPGSTTGDFGGQPVLNRLFRPIFLNRLMVKNRILMGSIHLNLDEFADQYERKAKFYATRARGGAALIITAGCSPNAAGCTGETGFRLDSDELIARHAKITAAVHQEGGLIALQLLHFGREAFHGKLVSASPVRLEANLFTPRELTEDEILQTVEDFGAAARRAVLAGYDAIELIFSQGFLVHQFLSPHTNQRKDRWGGSFENRMRLALQVAVRVRQAVGPHVPLLFRIPCLDLLPNGVRPDESIALIEALQPIGIDLLNVSIGWHESDVPTIAMVVPRAAFSPVAQRIKSRFPSLSVCVSNRINEPRLAERLLMEGVADMVSMARPFLSDPNIVSKARANQFDLINTCIACNQSCLDFVFTGHAVGCSVNPECGDEFEGVWRPLEHTRSIAVFGGGLAGMAAALYAAKRGARVDLFERSRTLGGQLNMARHIPKKGEFGETTRYFTNALIAHGVNIRLGHNVDRATLESGEWDHVIVATGTAANVPEGLPGLASANVLTYEQILRDEVPVEFPVVIIGGGGVACDLAKYLAQQVKRGNAADSFLRQAADKLPEGCLTIHSRTEPGTPVTLVQRSSKKFAYKLGRTTRWILINDLKESGIRLMSRQEILAITADGVEVMDRLTRSVERLPARTVALAVGQRPLLELANLCGSLGKRFSLIGAASDEAALASITSATASAYRAVKALP